MQTIDHSTFDFLNKLSRNNNRDWFNQHKNQYLLAQENVRDFVDELIVRMKSHDQLETANAKKSLYRIYNDVRFSKDKSPYNPRFAGYLKRSKPLYRGGYYYWIKPGGTMVGCGFTYPNAEDLKRIRFDIASNYDGWKRMLNSRKLKGTFGEMLGNQVKTAPRGFDKDDPAIALLRYKQFWFERSFSDEETLSKDFVQQVNKTFINIRPFFDYMSEVLTTDLNGESIL